MVDLSKITLIITLNKNGVNITIERDRVRPLVKGRLIYMWSTYKGIDRLNKKGR